MAKAMEVFLNPILPCSIIRFLHIKKYRNHALVMDESFPGKYLKTQEMINRAPPGPEPTLHTSEQLV